MAWPALPRAMPCATPRRAVPRRASPAPRMRHARTRRLGAARKSAKWRAACRARVRGCSKRKAAGRALTSPSACGSLQSTAWPGPRRWRAPRSAAAAARLSPGGRRCSSSPSPPGSAPRPAHAPPDAPDHQQERGYVSVGYFLDLVSSSAHLHVTYWGPARSVRAGERAESNTLTPIRVKSNGSRRIPVCPRCGPRGWPPSCAATRSPCAPCPARPNTRRSMRRERRRIRFRLPTCTYNAPPWGVRADEARTMQPHAGPQYV